MSENKPIEFRRMKARRKPKGRLTTDAARLLVSDILADAPRDKEYLIENLHFVQDATGGLSKDNLAALAKIMNLSFAAVYEVATFYHHFTLIDDGEQMPALAVRICRSLSCDMAGAETLMETLRDTLGDKVRILAAPCVGRCDAAPVAIVGQNAIEKADVDTVASAVAANNFAPTVPAAENFAAYQKNGGYDFYQQCASGKHDVLTVIEIPVSSREELAVSTLKSKDVPIIAREKCEIMKTPVFSREEIGTGKLLCYKLCIVKTKRCSK